MGVVPQHPLHAIHPPPSADPFVSLSPTLVCLSVHTGFGAHNPAGIPLTVAVPAQPRPGFSQEEKIMNETDAVLLLPRPPSPGNLGAGAALGVTLSRVGGGGARDLGQD